MTSPFFIHLNFIWFQGRNSPFNFYMSWHQSVLTNDIEDRIEDFLLHIVFYHKFFS